MPLKGSPREAARSAADAHIRKLSIKLAAMEDALSSAVVQRDALLACEGLSCREGAILASFRLHRGACISTGVNHHWAQQALMGAGWDDTFSRSILEKGAAARHLLLATMSDDVFGSCSCAELRRLTRIESRSAAQHKLVREASASKEGSGGSDGALELGVTVLPACDVCIVHHSLGCDDLNDGLVLTAGEGPSDG